MKRNLLTALLILIFLVGGGILLYPMVSDYINSIHQTRIVKEYHRTVQALDDSAIQAILGDAYEYNRKLMRNAGRFEMTEADQEEYQRQLRVPGSEVIANLRIGVIDVDLPVYHGTSEAVMQIGVGHFEGSSLPVGGLGTHAALSGHRGLPSSTLLTHLDRMEVGDTFVIHVFQEMLTYKVDQIRIVEPTDFSDLEIDREMDYCTLITCTPYGVNTHRLLVRGHRISNEETPQVHISAEASKIGNNLVALVIFAVLALFFFAWRLVRSKRRKGRR